MTEAVEEGSSRAVGYGAAGVELDGVDAHFAVV